jgi:hypothetical protein
MMLNTQAWPKYGYLEPQPGSLVPVTINRKGPGIQDGFYTGTASYRGRQIPVSAPVKGYLKIWSRVLSDTLANEMGGWN